MGTGAFAPLFDLFGFITPGIVAQVMIGVCGLSAVFLSQDPSEHRRRFACLFGMAGQPFWFYATFKAGQWGIFALSFVYAASWARGAWHFWVKPWITKFA